jgi:hypothetical protein
VDAGVLELPGVIVADCNAASDYVRFQTAASGLGLIDRARVFAQYWTHPDDQIDEWRHKSEKCAEALVPDGVAPRFVLGAYFANPVALARFVQLGVALTAEVKAGMFF